MCVTTGLDSKGVATRRSAGRPSLVRPNRPSPERVKGLPGAAERSGQFIITVCRGYEPQPARLSSKCRRRRVPGEAEMRALSNLSAGSRIRLGTRADTLNAIGRPATANRHAVLHPNFGKRGHHLAPVVFNGSVRWISTEEFDVVATTAAQAMVEPLKVPE